MFNYLPPVETQYIYPIFIGISIAGLIGILRVFFPNATATWNNIITHFETFPRFGLLKRTLISFFRPNHRSTYGVNDPTHLRYLFQLRLGLSHLRYHKRRHNFMDTPSATCLCKEGIEDTTHFLLHCPFHNMHRRTMRFGAIEILRENGLEYIENVGLYLYFSEVARK